jgi:hypothetical protein
VIDGLAFVITPDDNKLHTLNKTGALVWTLAESGCTLEEISLRMANSFEIAREQALTDALHFCEDLVARRILDKHD